MQVLLRAVKRGQDETRLSLFEVPSGDFIRRCSVSREIPLDIAWEDLIIPSLAIWADIERGLY